MLTNEREKGWLLPQACYQRLRTSLSDFWAAPLPQRTIPLVLSHPVSSSLCFSTHFISPTLSIFPQSYLSLREYQKGCQQQLGKSWINCNQQHTQNFSLGFHALSCSSGRSTKHSFLLGTHKTSHPSAQGRSQSNQILRLHPTSSKHY